MTEITTMEEKSAEVSQVVKWEDPNS